MNVEGNLIRGGGLSCIGCWYNESLSVRGCLLTAIVSVACSRVCVVVVVAMIDGDVGMGMGRGMDRSGNWGGERSGAYVM